MHCQSGGCLNGNIEVGVHIADVTHYVRTGSVLEKVAQERATSVYLVDRTIPMLPERISNHICSLNPAEDKLTYAAVFELDSKANVVKEWFGRTVIKFRQTLLLFRGSEGDRHRRGRHEGTAPDPEQPCADASQQALRLGLLRL
ncbi:MAG: RNB domain-containing ribonuclease [Marinilabiliales bacterium]|nr:RNB domain-containing ribonuclease [Marinilabiliales bacterium]